MCVILICVLECDLYYSCAMYATYLYTSTYLYIYTSMQVEMLTDIASRLELLTYGKGEIVFEEG